MCNDDHGEGPVGSFRFQIALIIAVGFGDRLDIFGFIVPADTLLTSILLSVSDDC